MRSQEFNKGELSELKVNIEKDIYESFLRMSEKSGYTLDELVVIAMRRFKVGHSDYEGTVHKDD